MADAPYHGAEAWDDPDHTDLYVFDGEVFLFDDEDAVSEEDYDGCSRPA